MPKETSAGTGRRDTNCEFIVPAKAVDELNRLLQDKGDVEVRYAENQASFTLKDDKGSGVLIITNWSVIGMVMVTLARRPTTSVALSLTPGLQPGE